MLLPTRVFLRFLLLSLWAGTCHYTLAQTNDNWYLSKVLNDNNGLPQNSVRRMYYHRQTDLLWLATEAGLVRYDGQDARLFDRKDAPYLHSMRILNLFPTVDGEVLGFNSAGEVFSLRNNEPAPIAGDFSADFDLNAYRIGNIRSPQNLVAEAKILKERNLSTLKRNKGLWLNNYQWLSYDDTRIYLVENNQVVKSWASAILTDLSFIARGKFVYAVSASATGYCIDVVSKTCRELKLEKGQPSLREAKFFYDKLNDQPLLLQEDKVYEMVFKESTVSIPLLASLPHLPSYITNIAWGKDKRYLFVATNATGLYIYRLSPFQVYTTSGDDILNNNYAVVLSDSSHLLTSRSLLYDVGTGISNTIPINFFKINSIERDNIGLIWGASDNAIINFSLIRYQEVVENPLAANEYLQAFYRAKNGNLWISTSQYLSQAVGRKLLSKIKFPNSDYSFSYLAETPTGGLIGLNNKGIYRIDTLHNTIIPEKLFKQGTQVRSMYVDDSSYCWIGTYGEGIFLYNLFSKQLTKLPVDDRGYLQYGHLFVADGQGNFLVPTNKGLFRLNRNNLLQIAAKPSTSLYYQYFDVADGLLTNEFNGGCQPGFVSLPNGDVVLPAIQGLVRVKIKELPTPKNSFFSIDKINTRLGNYKADDALHFTSKERFQTWQLVFAQWDRPNSQGIFFELDGGPTQRLAAGEKQIQLSELKGGSHVLKIKYQYGLQPKDYVLITRSFTIGRLYHETVWFWLMLLLMLIGIAYLAIQVRSHQLRQKNIQLQSIIRQNVRELSDKNGQLEETLLDLNEALKGLQENSMFKNRLLGLLGHDMLVPLRFIARIAGHLHTGAATFSPAETEENSSEIENTATELLYLGESLIQWIKLQEGTFHLIRQQADVRKLAEEIVQVHRHIAAVKKNQIECLVPAGSFVLYDPVFIKVILHNLLLNANKFTAGGTISIHAVITNKHLTIQVQDTGTGMNEAMVSSLNDLKPIPSQTGTHQEAGWGMGYRLIIDLLQFAGGSLQVQSSMGKGTIVAFSLPLGS